MSSTFHVDRQQNHMRHNIPINLTGRRLHRHNNRPLKMYGRWSNIFRSRVYALSSLCSAGSINIVGHYSAAITTYTHDVRRGCILYRPFFCARRNRIEGSPIRESAFSVSKMWQGVPPPTGVRTPYLRTSSTKSHPLRAAGL